MFQRYHLYQPQLPGARMIRSTLALLLAVPAFAQTVPWTAETSLIPSTQTGDPAFVSAPGVELVVGTDTAQTGIFTWNAAGTLQQVVPVGIVRSASARGALLVVSSSFGGLFTFEATDAGLVRLEPQSFPVPSPGLVALTRALDGGLEVWLDTQSLLLRHFAMSEVDDGGVTYSELPPVALPQPPSGLVADERSGRLYVAQPSLGVLRVEADGTSDILISIDAGQLGSRVGGLGLLHALDGGAVLFSTASPENAVVLHTVSGTQATFGAQLEFGPPDGGAVRVQLPQFLDVFDQPAPGFPRGVLVVQDTTGANYKLVSLADVALAFSLPPSFPEAPDAGVDGGVDAGSGGDGGSGLGVGGGSGTSRPPPSADPQPGPCGCTGGPFALFPALLLLWWFRRPR